jgi:hypothetical protein
MLAACKAQPETATPNAPTAALTPVGKTVGLGETVQLLPGGSVTISDTDLSIIFQEVVEDSRCPKDVQCVWAGQVIVRLGVSTGEQQAVSDVLMGLNGPPDAPNQVQVGNYTIELLMVEPYPTSQPVPIPPVVTLIVSETVGATAPPPGSPSAVPVPPVFSLVLGDQEIAGVRGTYCWSEPPALMCVDVLTPPDLPQYVEIASGEPIRIRFGSPAPDVATLNLYDAASYTGDPATQPMATSGELALLGGEVEWTPQVKPGDYILSVRGVWRERGDDAAYYFGLTIGGPAATPTSGGDGLLALRVRVAICQ